MTARLGIEEARRQFAVDDYKLISTEYKSVEIKLHLKCPRGHDWYCSLHNFQSGSRCKYCCNEKVNVNRKYTIEEVRKMFGDKGYTLLSKKYTNNRDKLKVTCAKGHTIKLSLHDFKASNGNRCKHCFNESRGVTRRLSYGYVQGYLASNGYTLITKEYHNMYQSLAVICPRKHEWAVNWNNFQQGTRCSECADENMRGESNPGWRGGESVTWYDTYAHQIDFCEEVRRDPTNEDYLQVRCTNCNEWFSPSRISVASRIMALDDRVDGEHRFYCSEECKHSCSIYGQKEFPKGFRSTTSRPHDYAVWADLIKKRDGHICQICGETEGINAHHYEGLHVNDMQSLDLDMGVTLCAECHHRSHTGSGCTYYDLQKRNVCGN